MFLTSGEYMPKVTLDRNLNEVIAFKKCFITKKIYYVKLQLRYYQEIKLVGTPNFSSLTINQRRFLIAWLTPAEYEALKKDKI